MTRVLVLSDTHGLFRPELEALLPGCELIVHAGDIGAPAVLERLATYAPVLAVRGNNDHGPWADALPLQATRRLAGWTLRVVQDCGDLDEDERADVIISGHSHRPQLEHHLGRLFLNPGSAGPRRFSLPVTVAELHLDETRPSARIIPLIGVHGPGQGPMPRHAAPATVPSATRSRPRVRGSRT